jgi:hypothetical protein
MPVEQRSWAGTMCQARVALFLAGRMTLLPTINWSWHWVKFVPTHVGKPVFSIGLVSRMRVIHFSDRGVPLPDGQFRLVVSPSQSPTFNHLTL